MIVLVWPLKYVQLLSLSFTLTAIKLWLCELLELQNPVFFRITLFGPWFTLMLSLPMGAQDI